MLMQMCKEDDFGQVPYDDFGVLLQQLRIDALHNAVVETDIALLRAHLILLLRREGMTEEGGLTIWEVRNVLLSAEQLCLSRMQIHVLLSIVHPNEVGDVDVEYFLRVACTVIPSMFDAATFMDKAATIYKEKQDAQAKAELEELQGIAGPLSTKRRLDDEDVEDVQANAPDRDAVEKTLIHIASTLDEKHRGLHYQKFLEAMHHESVSQCQLWESELRGFIAEAEIDERGEIAYHEHIRTWVPIIFELRRSRVYDAITSKDWGLNAPQLIDLSEYEEKFPLYLPYDPENPDRPGSQNSRRRPSLRGRRPSLGRGERPSSRQLRHSRSSNKDGIEDQAVLKRRNTGDKSSNKPRPNSRQDRPASRGEGAYRRPVSRTGSSKSLQRNNSSSSVESMASQRSNISRR